jgi:hypothetical protein
MAEYRIVAKIDPQTSAGANKVKQDLRGVQTEAKATDAALNKSFDQAKFDKTVGGLTSRIDQLAKGMENAGRSSVNAGKQFDTATGSIDRMTAAEFRAAGGVEGLTKAQTGAAGSSARLEASLRRVLQATDQEAAEQLRLNLLLADAKKLLDAGMISQERYIQVQRLATQAGKEQVMVSGSQRIGMQQLGFQLGDVATMYSLGARPAQIFGSQIGQISQALMLMGGNNGSMLSKVAGFLGGPWGIALTVGTLLLTPFISKLFDSNDALGDQMKKLKEDADASELSRQAHERWTHTLDALIERQGRLADAMRDRLKVQGLSDQSDLQQAQRDASTLQGEVQKQQQRLADLRKQLQAANAPVALTGGHGDEARLGQQALDVSRIQSQIKDAETQLGRLQGAANDAQKRIASGQIIVGEQAGKALVDLTARASQWSDRYQDALRGILLRNDQLRAQTPQITAGFESVKAAVDKAASAGLGFQSTLTKARDLGVQLQDGKISVAGYRGEMAKLADQLTKAAEAAEKAKRQTSDGVATFVSARQAIGLAGREFQQAGFRVTENSQFGGVTPGVHKGQGHADDRAVDINFGSGVTEANVPDIRARLDAMAVRYAARGYIVLWNGKRYDPSGKVTAIAGGQDQHRDHMHLEAPRAIVGKPTQASTEAQAQREEKSQAQVVERAEDFVANVVRQAAVQGLATDAKTQLNAAIADKLAEFKTKFDREANPNERAAITAALTDADARATAQRFQEAYVDPLQRLEALQGKVGIDRAILNAELEETKRLGRELTPVEKEQIENGIRRGDQLQREAALLEQIRGPMDDYRKMIETLNGLLAKGEISQAAYNARLAEMNNQATQSALSGLKGVAPDGTSFEDIAANSDENARYAAQLEAIDEFRKKKLDIGVSYDQLELAAAQQHAQNIAAIEQARKDLQLGAAEDIAAGVTGAMKTMFGEQSKLYKAAFAVEKAVAIARSIVAIQTGIAQAAALPFPANLPAIASVIAATASILSNIQAVALNFKDGGMVTGPGGPRSDSIAANLSRGEFVVNARATAGNRALLEAINDGREVRQMGNARAAETARVQAAAAPPVTVNTPPAEVQVVNVNDPRAALNALNTAEGKKVIMNIMESDPNTFRRLLGAS